MRWRLKSHVLIVCSTVCSSADQRKHQCSASLALVRGIHVAVTGGFPSQRASNTECVSIWCHHVLCWLMPTGNKSSELILRPFTDEYICHQCFSHAPIHSQHWVANINVLNHCFMNDLLAILYLYESLTLLSWSMASINLPNIHNEVCKWR